MPDERLDAERRFGSVDRAYGMRAVDALARTHIAVVGVGGVGSWAAEALARSGVGILTLIDMDHVAQSNVNRQVHALESTLGQAKVQAMSARIAQINPACRVHQIDEFVDPANVSSIVPADAGMVLDCTDQLSAKVAMVLCARERSQSLLVCGAAGGKTDGLALKKGDLRDSTHDSLLARLRSTLRRQHGFAPSMPKRSRPLGVQVLWFDQPTHRPASMSDRVSMPLACAGYGSLVTVTAAVGLAAAAHAIDCSIARAVMRASAVRTV